MKALEDEWTLTAHPNSPAGGVGLSQMKGPAAGRGLSTVARNGPNYTWEMGSRVAEVQKLVVSHRYQTIFVIS